QGGSPRLPDYWPAMTLGFLEVSLGRYTEALAILQPVISVFNNVPGTEILTAWYIPDAVEAMVALGRFEDAEPLIAALERNGRQLNRAWMLAVGMRCRSMWLAARGDVAGAEQVALQAMTEHERLPMPFERARTQLLLGQLQRRQRRKDAAAATLHQALFAFETMGTPLWAEHARGELVRTRVSPGRDPGLTPTEQRVAELAASGMINRDVAAALFISPKTVEHHLARVYRKLGIHSRAELGQWMRQSNVRETPDSPGAVGR
ncbi:MAG: LuxR family transcriptional regulator, partial [Mycobacterium sp.]|nr:LuxR family transcriptional regulator [Mycobacterium sp.]